MDPNFGEWSASEILMAKDLIASHNTNNIYANYTKKKHTDTVDVLQAMFPTKEKNKVTNLYIDLMVEMMQATVTTHQDASTGSKLVNNKLEVPPEVSAMEHMNMLCGYPEDERGAKRKVDEAPHRQLAPRKQRQCPVKFWTKDEHRSMILFILSSPFTHI